MLYFKCKGDKTMDRLEVALKIYARIKEGNYSMVFYWHYSRDLELFIEGISND
jgi:hypothetical protein